MIQPQDLRVGNYIYNNEGAITKVALLGADLVMVDDSKKVIEKNCAPIPLTDEWFIKLGFTKVHTLIQDSYELVLIDEVYVCEFTNLTTYSYKSISASMCNDKGLGEYYLFIRQGSTNKRHQDDIVSSSRNLLYVHTLQNWIQLLKP